LDWILRLGPLLDREQRPRVAECGRPFIVLDIGVPARLQSLFGVWRPYVDRLLKQLTTQYHIMKARSGCRPLENSAQELSLLHDGVDFTRTPRSPVFHAHAAPSCG
jgi:hypothetical protein